VRIGVVGGSISGCAVGALLSRAGHDVTVLERSSGPLHDRGAGVIITGSSLARMHESGLVDPRMPALAVVARRFARCASDRAGASVICELDFPGGAFALNWGVLWRHLRDGVSNERYWTGCAASRLTAAADGALVLGYRCRAPEHHLGVGCKCRAPEHHLGVGCKCRAPEHDLGVGPERPALEHDPLVDGERRTLEVDLVVGADGYRSTVREWIGQYAQPVGAGYVLWRGTVPEAAVAEHALHLDATRPLTVGYRHGHVMIYLLPAEDGGTEPGRRLVNWAIYDTVDTAALETLFGSDDRSALRSIVPGQASPAQRAYIRSLAGEQLPVFLEQIVAATADPFCQPIHDLTVTSYATRTAALVGDAGTVARPHAGAGVGKALDDAFALVDALDQADDTRAGLAAYNSERLRVGNELVDTGRRLGEILVVDPLDWDRVSGAELQAAVEASHQRIFEITAEHRDAH
jgi:2-polyprenyl-6-methoxyphenol hydroxylase-like FAD-dependent oxidoreductase